MNKVSGRISVFAVLFALLLMALMTPLARSQFQAAPSFQPIGVAASGNISSVWFHEPASNRVLACQTVATPGAGLSGIQCVASKLPQ